MTGAMSKDLETGLVKVEEDKCVGCWMCIMVCPFGAIFRSEDSESVLKCDFCPESPAPVCVENCPQEALALVEV
jgi:carbon-monoxide dehydrogenase iron sulfur subunit